MIIFRRFLYGLKFQFRNGIIGGYAFYNCSALSSVEFDENSSTTRVGHYAFENCTSLTEITIKQSTVYNPTVGKCAFRNCTGLTEATITTSALYENAFEGCVSLKTVRFYSKSIREEAFKDCTSLTSIEFSGTTSYWTDSVDKGTNWNLNVPAIEIVCSDGSVSLN